MSPLLWYELQDRHDDEVTLSLPTGHQSLSILLYVARKTSHCGRITPPSCTKWWSCIFRERFGPLATKWSAVVAFTLHSGGFLYEKLKEERLVPDDLDAALSTLRSKVSRYRQSQILYTLNDIFVLNFSSCKPKFTVVTEEGMEVLVLDKAFCECRATYKAAPYTGAYTNYHLSMILMNLQDVPWLDLNVQHFLATKEQGLSCYAFSR